MMFSSQIDAFSPSQFTPSQNAGADSTTPSKVPPPSPPSFSPPVRFPDTRLFSVPQFRGASGTTPLTVKQIADAQLAGAGEKGAPFAVDGVETANVPSLPSVRAHRDLLGSDVGWLGVVAD
jgi:replication factor A2